MIHLTHSQESKLRKLESDPLAKMMGVLGDCPVVLHSGVVSNHLYEELSLCALRSNGRLNRLGSLQAQYFWEHKKGRPKK